MMQIIKQTDEEKMAMYMKMPKKKIAEMLIQCNKALDMHYVESKISSSAVLAVSLPPEKIGTIELSEREKEQVAKNFKDVFGGNDR